MDTFKESHSTSRLIVAFAYGYLIYKSRNTSDCFIFLVDQYPTDAFTMSKGFIFFLIKNRFNVLIERPNPVGFVFIKSDRKFQEFSYLRGGANFLNLHHCSTSTWGVLWITLFIRFGN